MYDMPMNLADLANYDYDLPESLIRKEGVEPRDSAKLFVYDTKTDTITHDVFANIAQYLPEYAVLVRNDTRVVPARLHLKKATGGKIEVFVLMNELSRIPSYQGSESRQETYNPSLSPTQELPFYNRGAGDDHRNLIPVLVDRKCGVGWKLFFPNGDFFEVVSQEENKFFVVLNPSNSGSTPDGEPLLNPPLGIGEEENRLQVLLNTYGETPIPPYLQGDEWLRDEEKLRSRYQTIFAAEGRSVAAPTAALHFTERVFDALRGRDIDMVSVTLDVGLGTFAKLKEEHFTEKKLHAEYIIVLPEVAAKINQAKSVGRSVIVVGTTALRTVESCTSDGRVEAFSGDTDIFISPPHHFAVPDILITNFHIPKSSLMLLVDAFLRDKGAKRNLVTLYEEAIREKYAFYSFGDSMLIL